MINEEDHFRIQAFEKAFNIDEAYNKIIEVDNEISKNIEYAYTKDYGYITACPTCLGTGMRVSVMLHLPSLEKIGALEKIFNEISNLGISIRGIYGENTNGDGSIYQISNQKTLGIKEEDIIEQVKQVTNYIVKQEKDNFIRMSGGIDLLQSKSARLSDVSKTISRNTVGQQGRNFSLLGILESAANEVNNSKSLRESFN